MTWVLEWLLSHEQLLNNIAFIDVMKVISDRHWTRAVKIIKINPVCH